MDSKAKASELQIKNILAKSSGLLKGKNAPRLVVALGLIGMLLVMLSGLQPATKANRKTAQLEPQTLTTEQYTQALEKRLGDVISSIRGVGEVKIMITLDKSVEYVYAQDVKTSVDRTQDIEGNNVYIKQEKENSEGKYILVDSPEGKRQALLTTSIEPQIKGVVVVCQGADDIQVVAMVTEAVTTALNITSNRVCVTKLG